MIGQHRGHEQGVDLDVPKNSPRIEKMPSTTSTSCSMRHDRADAVEQGILRVAEGIGDVEQDADRGEATAKTERLRIAVAD